MQIAEKIQLQISASYTFVYVYAILVPYLAAYTLRVLGVIYLNFRRSTRPVRCHLAVSFAPS